MAEYVINQYRGVFKRAVELYEAEKFKEEILEEFPGFDIHIDPLSLSVSCHIGPGALAIACSKKI